VLSDETATSTMPLKLTVRSIILLLLALVSVLCLK
jgi:hypothetical protein